MIGFLKWLKRLCIGLVALAIVGFGYQQRGEWQDKRAFPMPGRLVSVGDHRLHIRCIGQGSPTIVMLAGAGSPSVNSYDLQNELARISRVCSYDRAGLGWSDPPKAPMGLQQIVTDLETLLSGADEKGPFVLVPESFGGMVALTLATRSPAQVAGIVAVDASEPQSWQRLGGARLASAKMRNIIWQVGWRIGLVRILFNSQAPSWAEDMSPNVRSQFAAVWSRPMASFANDSIDAYEQTALADLPSATPRLLSSKPLIVISHGRSGEFLSPEFEASWPEAQKKWTKLSARSEHIIARENSHMIAQENPKIVADAVAKIVEELRIVGVRP